jgi:UDP-N-acetylmuramoyl-tripeptide--D-alanyl-D-alanine ligase
MIFTANQIIEALKPIKYNIKFNSYNSISIDSRKCTQGTIFFALRGNKTDGHTYILSAFKNGASLVITEKEVKDFPFIMVKDTKKSLIDFLRYFLLRINAKKIAITGSIGKTTTRTFLKHLIGKSAITTEKNYNTEISVPTILNNVEQGTDYLIFEFGLQHKGDIEYLAEAVRPDISVITKISNVHKEFFSDLNEIIREKMSLLNYTSEFAVLESGLKGCTNFKNVLYVPYNSNETLPYIHLSLEYDGKKELILRNIPSLFSSNLRMALEVCKFLKIPFEKLNIQDLYLPENRFNLKRYGEIDVISDYYNSSPYSLESAIEYIKHFLKDRRIIVVLGDMLELGDDSLNEHKKLSEKLKDFDVVILYGKLMKFANKGYNYFEDKEKAIKFLLKTVRKNDLVFIKGSRGMKMEDFEEAIKCS